MAEFTRDESKDAVWTMYHEGYRLEVIAERLGFTLRTVCVYMNEKRREEGIAPRKTGFANASAPVAPPKKKLIAYAGAPRHG